MSFWNWKLCGIIVVKEKAKVVSNERKDETINLCMGDIMKRKIDEYKGFIYFGFVLHPNKSEIK